MIMLVQSSLYGCAFFIVTTTCRMFLPSLFRAPAQSPPVLLLESFSCIGLPAHLLLRILDENPMQRNLCNSGISIGVVSQVHCRSVSKLDEEGSSC